MEEGVVLRRDSLVLAPSEEKSTVVLVPPFGTNFAPTCCCCTTSGFGAVIVNQPIRSCCHCWLMEDMDIDVLVTLPFSSCKAILTQMLCPAISH
jgi:hypothetical protein